MNCVYCGGELTQFRLERIESLFGNRMFFHEFKNLCLSLTHDKCTSCGSIVSTDARISNQQALLEVYSQMSSQYWEEIESQEDKNFFDKIERYINPEKRNMTICDVGCGNGSFLVSLDKCWKKIGVEPSPIANILLDKEQIPYFNSTLKDSGLTKHTIDIITYIDVFEHLINPVEEIEIAKNFLSTDGKLVILTANSTSINAKLAGRSWIYLRNIGHITIASKQGLVDALKRKGFSKVEVIKVNHPASANFFKWLVYLTASKLTGGKETIMGGRGNVPLFYDHMLIIASL
jgi:SAM-dependent methyltransferase